MLRGPARAAGPGRRRRQAVVAATREIASITMSTPVEPVHATTRSAAGHLGEPCRGSGRGSPWRRAGGRRVARSVRLTTVDSGGPARGPRSRRRGQRLERRRDQDCLACVSRPLGDPVERGRHQARARPGRCTLSACARLPTRRACWNSGSGPGRRCPAPGRAERLAGLAEDLALADRIESRPAAPGTGARPRCRRSGRRGAAARSSPPGALDQQPRELLDAAVEAVDVGVHLGPVAGRDDRRLGDVLAGRRRRASSLAAPSPSTATRSSTETGADRWEMPTTRTLMPSTSRGRREFLRCSW